MSHFICKDCFFFEREGLSEYGWCYVRSHEVPDDAECCAEFESAEHDWAEWVDEP